MQNISAIKINSGNGKNVLTQESLLKRKQELISILPKLRLQPDSFRSKNGKTRDEYIKEIERWLDEIEQALLSAPYEGDLEANQSSSKCSYQSNQLKKIKPQKISKPITNQDDQSHLRVVEDTRNKVKKMGGYIHLGGIHVPVCETQDNLVKWEAVPGKMFVSGGRKFSEIKFVKDTGGITYTAKPGELLKFSQKHRNKRLETVDTILEGKKELKALKKILVRLSAVVRDYEDLNPDLSDYDNKAKHYVSEIEKFTDPESLLMLFDIEQQGITDPEDFAERVAEIITTQQFLRSIDETGDEFIPELDHTFKLTPFFEEKFAWFAQLVNRQLGLGNNAYLQELVDNNYMPAWEELSAKGMTVIVGPRGTGKNKLTDYYCAVSNRPLFRYACSPDKEERDLTYDVELSDGEVVRIPTRILTAVTTPNAVLELDELNLLRPNVAKFFNSLFDGDRTVFLNDQVVKAAPGVIFVGLMNPADYDGVEDLPETIDDRSNIMQINYPVFRKINRTTNYETFSYDEALILKDNITPLKEISDDIFIKAWNNIVNFMGENVSLDPKLIKIIKDLKNIIAIANRTRELVEAYKTRRGDLRMERDISLRGTIEAVRFYSENHLWSKSLVDLPDYKPGWNAAQYTIAMTYLPHTLTYRKGKNDRESMMIILAESIQ